ncbi:MAG: hypothetical protein IKM22_03970 [Clostridia bacterium]|nr:hypothetical protein [Clostridia bacterium]
MNEKTKKILTYFLYVILMYSCALLGAALFMIGVYANFLAMFIAILLSYLAYKKTNKILDLLFLDLNLLLSVFISGRCTTILYYKNISSDHMSLVIGNIFTGVGLLIASIIVLIFLIARIILIIIEKRKQKKDTELCSD